MKIKARHILVNQEFEARDLLKKLDEGADFAELARQFSQCPSSEEGGDLGAFTRDAMVKSFADAAFALQVGETTTAPVRTQFGFHLIHRYA